MNPTRHALPRSTIAIVAAAAALLFGGPPARAGSVRYDVQELWTPEGVGTISFANDINHRGQLAGFVQSGDISTRRAAVWDGATTLKLVLGDASFSEAYALNNAGQAVGWVSYSSGKTRAALWNGTQLSLLDTAGAWGDRAVGINDNGLIVGSVIAANGYQHAAAWDHGWLTDLGATVLQSNEFSTASAVNAWGQITGSSTLPVAAGFAPLMWQADGGRYTVSGHYSGVAINDLGQVLSLEDVGSGNDHRFVPILIDNGQARRLLPGAQEGFFYKLNNAGQAVGVTGYAVPTLWSASGGAVALNSVLQPGSAPLIGVNAINDDGQMAATIASNRAALLTPSGRLRWIGADGGSFNDAANWDSGLGLAPSRFLDVELASAARVDVIGVGYALAVKSLVVGGGGGVNTLLLVDGGRIDALGGTLLRDGGRLATWSGSDGLYATGRLGGDLTLLAGSGLVLKADAPGEGNFDRIVVDGLLQIDGGDLFLGFDSSGYMARRGDSWDLLDFGSLAGRFSHLWLPTLGAGLAWDSSRLYSEGVLSVQAAVPEPGCWLMIVAGLLALGWRARRQGA